MLRICIHGMCKRSLLCLEWFQSSWDNLRSIVTFFLVAGKKLMRMNFKCLNLLWDRSSKTNLLLTGQSTLSQLNLFKGGWYTHLLLHGNCEHLFLFQCIVYFCSHHQYWIWYLCNKKPVAEAFLRQSYLLVLERS